jgi:hypothetical protein
MEKYGVFKPTRLPPGRLAIRPLWIFGVKQNEQGFVEKFKARLVAQGNTQRPGLDYNDTFAPVARKDTVRALLAVAAAEDYELKQLDVQTAFLNGELDEEIYMRAPPGYDLPHGCNTILLLKAIYGLKQASRAFNKKLHRSFEKLELVQSDADACLYIRKTGGVLLVAVIVDDMIVATNSIKLFHDLRQGLEEDYGITDKGDLRWCLGILIQRERKSRIITLSQERYIQDMLVEYKMDKSKAQSIPADVSRPLNKSMSPTTDKGKKEMLDCPYRSLVGALLYLANTTRLDIAFQVGALARFGSNPGEQHWIAAKKVLRYLKGSMDVVLTYGPGTVKLEGFNDADYDGDVDSRRSMTGYLFRCCPKSSPISWRAKLQPTVAQSTAEAEYMAAVAAANQAIWLRRLFEDMGYKQITPTVLNEDNQSCIAMSENPVFHERTKHIDIKHHVLRTYVQNKQVVLKYLPTEVQLADILTKALSAKRFLKLRSMMLGVCSAVDSR